MLTQMMKTDVLQIKQQAAVKYKILLDVSDSMDALMFNGRTRLETLAEKLLNSLNAITDKSAVEVYAFSDKPRFFANGDQLPQDGETLARELADSGGGGTRIMDSIHEIVLKTIDEYEDENSGCVSSENNILKTEYCIICITDGEDLGCLKSIADIQKLIESRAGIKLKLIYITDAKTPAASSDEDDQPDGADKTAEKAIEIIKTDCVEDIIIDFTPAPVPAAPLNPYCVPEPPSITCSVIPLENADPDGIAHIRKCVNRAVFYIEKMTGLRYYPVPTVIVDRHIIAELKKVKIEMHPLDIKKRIEELGYIINQVALKFYHLINTWDPFDKACINQFIPVKDPIAVQRLKQFTESVGYIVGKSMEGIAPTDNLYKLMHPLISRRKDIVGYSYDLLQMILVSLKNFAAANPAYEFKNLFYGRLTSCKYDNGARDWVEDYYYVTPESLAGIDPVYHNKICRNYDAVNECWKCGIFKVIDAFSAAVEAAFELIGKLDRYKGKNYLISSRLHTFGMYMPPGSAIEGNLRDKFIKAGCSERFINSLRAGGMVLIAADECRQLVSDSADYETFKEKSKLNKELVALQNSVIESTLVHEHTHAAIAEGIEGRRYARCKPADITGIENEYAVASETLAEWSELNYFRYDGEVYDIILGHVRSGNLPSWPYAGALLIEKLPESKRAAAFKKTVSLFRSNPLKAYKYLLKYL